MSLPILSGTGRATADPELRFSASGVPVCKVNLAFNSRKKNEKTGEWEDGDVFFINGTLFNDAAEHVAESVSKGMELVVAGRIKTRSYETREGDKRSVVELLIDSIGPSLRYATASVKKMQRSSQGAAAGPADDPWAGASPNPNRPAQQQPAAAAAGFSDEPPF